MGFSETVFKRLGGGEIEGKKEFKDMEKIYS